MLAEKNYQSPEFRAGSKRFFTLRHRAMTSARGRTRQWVHLAFNMQKKSDIQEVEAESGYKGER